MNVVFRMKGTPVLKLRYVPGIVGPSGTVTLGTVTTGAPGTDVIITNTGTPQAAVLNFTIPEGDKGDTGDKGWSPILAIVTDGARRVAQISDWTGGQGTKPAAGSYIGPTGLVAAIADGVDIRGAVGPSGSVTDGDKGDIVVSASGAVWTVKAGAVPASKIANTPAGSIAATTVQAALAELDTEKQPIDALLTSIASLSAVAGKGIHFTGVDTADLHDETAFGISLQGATDALSGRVLLEAARDDAAASQILNINPWMEIDQQNNGSAVTTAGAFATDQHRIAFSGTMAVSAARTANPFTDVGYRGHAFSHKVTITTPQASLSAGHNLRPFQEHVEDINIRHLGWGTADAQDLDIILILKASVAGTVPVAVLDAALALSYVTTVTLAANAATAVLVRIPGPTTGTWSSSGQGGIIIVGSANGTTYNAPSANSWQAGEYYSVAGTVNWAATNGATFQVGACILLPAGTTGLPPGFITGAALKRVYNIRRPWAAEFQRCQRYYAVMNLVMLHGNSTAGAFILNSFRLPISMRASPTLTFGTVTYSNMSTLAASTISDNGFFLVANITASGSGYAQTTVTASARL